MDQSQKDKPIGIFDSGIGGISVLGEMARQMPGEKYIYLADSANAPYGTKSSAYVREVSLKAARSMSAKGIKALVVACNTATSVAIKEIREELDIPVIGMEPALKPAVETSEEGIIVVMATPLTLQEEKFNSLFRKFNTAASIIPLPCKGLVELIEAEAGSGQIRDLVQEIMKTVPLPDVSTIVLGCTHYCFIRDEIMQVTGAGPRIIDGNEGTARHLKNTLQAAGLLVPLCETRRKVDVEFLTTGDSRKTVPLCKRFWQKALRV